MQWPKEKGQKTK